MKSSIKSYVFLNKYSIYKPSSKPYLKKLLRNQFLSKSELEELNWSKTKDLISYAYEKVPYYKRRFNESDYCLPI